MAQTEKTQMRRLLSLTRKAVQEYDLIQDGDRVCVGLSGGKDSMTLLAVLVQLQRFYPKKFELKAVHVSLGFEGMDLTPMQEFCAKLNVPLEIADAQIAKIVFDIRKEPNPCALCANLRRGAVNDYAGRMGCNVVALAHHRDDIIETALMSLFFEGRFYCFEPKTWLDRAGVRVIRPFLYLEEKEIKRYQALADVPVVHNPCPMDRESERARVKSLINELPYDKEMLRTNIFGAVRRGVWQPPDCPPMPRRKSEKRG